MNTWFINSFAEEIWQKKYAGIYENIETYFKDLAKLVSLGDHYLEGKFFRLLWEKRFSPGGRILAAAGRPSAKVSMMNCTTHQIEDDTLEAIAHAVEVVMRASSRGQGIGIDVSKLRPRGSAVNNSAVTSTGAVSFMELINHAGGIIGQQGRRAALLFSLDVSHPDIWRVNDTEEGLPYDFLHIKKIPGRVENANISVVISDEFMQAVREDKPWLLRFNGEVNAELTVSAQDLFERLSRSAMESAEPGILFKDTTKRFSNSDAVGWPVVGVNACQPEFATVLTKDGIRLFKDIEVGTEIWGGKFWVKVINKWGTGIKPVYRITSSRGEFIGTLDHKVFDQSIPVAAADAGSFDQAVGPADSQNIELDYQAVMDGLVLGDGSFHKAERSQKIHLYVGDHDTDYFFSSLNNFIGEQNGISAPYTFDVITTITKEELPHTYLRTVPDRFYFGDTKLKRSFLRGLFSANGYVVSGKANRVGLKASSQKLIKQVQEMLSSMGIDSYITISQEKKQKFYNGTYVMKEAYDLNITTHADLFMSLIGFVQEYKNKSYIDRGSSNNSKLGGIVQKYEYLGSFDVYEITVDSEAHSYWSGGLLVSNCTEQLLDQEGVCNLGSMNLGAYVDDPFSPDATFNFKDFYKDSKTAIKFLDNVLTLELQRGTYISDKQRRSIEQLRRIGLGVMGYADMLAMLLLPYRHDNEQTVSITEAVFKTLRNAAYNASIEMVEREGCERAQVFNEINPDEYLDKGFFATLSLEQKMRIRHAKGLRNVTLLSIAPTGSISNLLGVSSGIEPLFALEYKRRHRIYGEDRFINYIHPLVEESRKAGVDDAVWVTAHEASPEDHLMLQAIAQRYIDQSISKTTNLPGSSTVEDVMHTYQMAHELGLKGLAVYVDGSRHEQILYHHEEKEACPVCGEDGNIVHQNGCKECSVCGWAVCLT